ncbi:MAG: hypothetical protein RLZZ127_3026 [Planctomycetota bacterium]|jgi:hypothetical protein
MLVPMRVLAFLVKLPTETFKGFNDRLAQACQVLRPTAARLALVDDQPKVTLIDAGQGGPVRVAVCPQEAGDDAQAAKTEERLGRVLAAAEGQPVSTVEDQDGQCCLFLWPVTAPAPAVPADGAPPPPATPTKRTAGRPQFGFRGGANGWEEHPEEGLIVRTILDCLDSGLTHDRVDRRLMEEHGDWIREHWNPRDRHKLIARIVERADWYRQHLPAEAPEPS